jgi:hypothetical protein
MPIAALHIICYIEVQSLPPFLNRVPILCSVNLDTDPQQWI